LSARLLLAVIFVSRGLEETRRLQLGVIAYVVKVVDFHEFVDAVRELACSARGINQAPPGSGKRVL
jgi:hypothetical protein